MRFNLFKQIALYVGILILVVCLGLGLTSYKFSSDSIINEAEKSLSLLAQEGVRSIESIISGQLYVLEILANNSSIRTMDWEKQLPILQQEFERLENRGYLGMGIVYPDGNTRYIDGSEANLGDRNYIKKAFSGESVVSDVIISRVTNSTVLMYATPIYNLEGEVGAVLIARNPGDALNEITDQMGFGREGYAYIIGNDGTFFSHPNREYVMEQKNINSEIENDGKLKDWALAIEKIGLGKAGLSKYNVDGTSLYTALEVFPSNGWTLGIVATEGELLEGLTSLKNTIIISSLIFIILGICISAFIGMFISKPIQETTAHAVDMASGDFTQSISEKYLKRKDEIGELAKAFNLLAMNFRKTIGGINASIRELVVSSEKMAITSQSSSANMQEISAATEEISAGMEEISAATEEISASSEQMNASAEQLIQNTKNGNRIAKEIEEKASKIEEKVIYNQGKAVKINKELGIRLKEGIEKAKIVNEISNMADQIAGIAEQTNLLALNAAIEAARAGEHGRGFAVVAEEVRKLAAESSDTVTNIQNLTLDVQSNINSLIEDANKLLTFMNTDVEDDYKKFLEIAKEYMNDAKTFYGLTYQASNMGEEVLNVINEVTRSINEVAQTIAQSAEGTDQIAKGTDEASKSMVEISEASNKLAIISEKLTKLIDQFKI